MSVRPFVCSSVHGLSFFACVSETERDRSTKIGNRLPQEEGKLLFHHQNHTAKFTALAGPKKAKQWIFKDFLENGSNDFFHFLCGDTWPYKEQLFPLAFFRKKIALPGKSENF